MKKLHLLCVCILVTAIFSSCSDDDDSPTSEPQENQFTFDSASMELKAGAVEYYGAEDGVHYYDIALVTSNVDVETGEVEDDTYSRIYFELFTDSEDLTESIYTFSTSDNAGTFSNFSDITIDMSVEEEGMYYELVSGTFNVISTNPYEFSFEGTAKEYENSTAEEISFSGYYKGTMQEFDYSEE